MRTGEELRIGDAEYADDKRMIPSPFSDANKMGKELKLNHLNVHRRKIDVQTSVSYAYSSKNNAPHSEPEV